MEGGKVQHVVVSQPGVVDEYIASYKFYVVG